MENIFMITDIRTRLTFILEYPRRDSKRPRASVMPAEGPVADRRIALRRVPLYIRQACYRTRQHNG